MELEYVSLDMINEDDIIYANNDIPEYPIFASFDGWNIKMDNLNGGFQISARKEGIKIGGSCRSKEEAFEVVRENINKLLETK